MVINDEIAQIIDHELGSIEVDSRGLCRWTAVANAQTHILAQVRAALPHLQAQEGQMRERAANVVHDYWAKNTGILAQAMTDIRRAILALPLIAEQREVKS